MKPGDLVMIKSSIAGQVVYRLNDRTGQMWRLFTPSQIALVLKGPYNIIDGYNIIDDGEIQQYVDLLLLTGEQGMSQTGNLKTIDVP